MKPQNLVEFRNLVVQTFGDRLQFTRCFQYPPTDRQPFQILARRDDGHELMIAYWQHGIWQAVASDCSVYGETIENIRDALADERIL